MDVWEVSQEESGKKLQAFLKGKCNPAISARQIKRGIEAGDCWLNGKAERFASKVVGRGDKVAFILAKTKDQETDRYHLSERVLYADEEVIAYNKPAGINADDSLLQASLQGEYGEAILLHRLDRETTGVLLFARNETAAKRVLALFKQRKVKKKYLAIVDGHPAASEGVIDNQMGKLHVYQGQTLWGEVSPEKGVRAITHWQCERKGKEAALIVCYPETGRTHQLRVHLKGLGHPILGDSQYGRSFRCKYRAPRVMLHAAEISFGNTKVQAPLPKDFIEAVKDVL